MRNMEDNSIDFIVTDPPYGLHFMGKNWDGRVPAIEIWAESLRVCKPGSMLAAFGGSRTHHHLMLAIEGAGWEIRDVVMWVYGSGFPKSLDISKTIDKRNGKSIEWFGSWLKQELKNRNISNQKLADFLEIHPDTINNWAYGSRFPTNENVNKIYKFLNINFEKMEQAKRENIGFGKYHNPNARQNWCSSGNKTSILTSPSSDLSKKFDGYGTALKPAYEPIIIAMKPLDGTFGNNAEKWGVAGINIDKSRIETSERPLVNSDRHDGNNTYGKGLSGSFSNGNTSLGRWPSNLILSPESAEQLDHMTGFLKGSSGRKQIHTKVKSDIYQSGLKSNDKIVGYDETGGASRFFYCAKASSSERNRGLEKNTHPTVKPISLMKYIITLLAPPANPICLDPFMGSGSTGVACKELGIDFIGIEKEKEYIEIAEKRIYYKDCY